MSLFRFFFRAEGLKEVKARLRKLRGRMGFKAFTPVRRSIVIALLKKTDEPLAASAKGSPPRRWPKLAAITVFIRAHRAQRKNKTPRIGVDSGVMRLSNRPFASKGGKEFGIENRLKRAQVFNFGGVTTASSVQIGSFSRRRSKKSKKTGKVKVKSFRMDLAGGNIVPRRRFLPTEKEVRGIVGRILRIEEKKIAKEF